MHVRVRAPAPREWRRGGARLHRYARRLVRHDPPDRAGRQAGARDVLLPPQRGVPPPPLPRPQAEAERARAGVPHRGRPVPPRRARRRRRRRRDHRRRPLRDLAGPPDRAEMAFAVVDEWQGRGLGTALGDRLVAQARASGLAALTGSTFAFNAPAKALLKRLGFLPKGISSGVADYELASAPRCPRPPSAAESATRSSTRRRRRASRRGGRRSAPRSRARRPATSRAAARRPRR